MTQRSFSVVVVVVATQPRYFVEFCGEIKMQLRALACVRRVLGKTTTTKSTTRIAYILLLWMDYALLPSSSHS